MGAAASALGGDAALAPLGGIAAPAMSYAASHLAGKLSDDARTMAHCLI